MKLRVRFQDQRFSVDIKDDNATLLTLKEAVCKVISLRATSEVKISLNGKEAITGNQTSLSSHGLVSGDLVYILSPLINEQCNNASEDVAVNAFPQVNNNASVSAALDVITKHQFKSEIISQPKQHYNEGASTSHCPPQIKQRREKVVPSPVFCRDGVSNCLAHMYEAANVKTQHEALMIILHALMLESGFLSQKESNIIDNQFNEVMPTGWNERSTTKFQYMHHLSPSIPCELVVTSLGPFIYAHVWSPVMDGSYEVKLVVSQFVKGNISLSTGASMIYQNLHKASRLVKDNLIHPFLATLRHSLGMTSPFTLVGLPLEIQLIVFSLLDAKSTLKLSQTCKELNHISNDQKLWKFFCQRDFGVKETRFGSWKRQYINEYQEQKQRCRWRAGHFVLPQQYSDEYFNPFLPHFPPGKLELRTIYIPEFALQGQDWSNFPAPIPPKPALPLRVCQTSRLKFPH